MNVAIDNANMIGKTIVIAIAPLILNFFIFDFLFYWFVDFVELLNQIFDDQNSIKIAVRVHFRLFNQHNISEFFESFYFVFC